MRNFDGRILGVIWVLFKSQSPPFGKKQSVQWLVCEYDFLILKLDQSLEDDSNPWICRAAGIAP